MALVIGNDPYERADKLDNPVTDARRMRENAANKLGFQIVDGDKLAKQRLAPQRRDQPPMSLASCPTRMRSRR